MGELPVRNDVPEADWRLFRKLRERALERFSAQILGELASICEDRSRGAHDRYLQLWRLLRERNEEMARTFDNPRRSMMHVHLAAMDELSLVESGDLSRMTTATQMQLRKLRSLPRDGSARLRVLRPDG